MNLTKQQKIMIGGTTVFILVISVIIFVIIKHNNKSKTSDQCEWSYTDWSTVCTDGKQSRVVSCKNKEGVDCDNSKCTSTKPTDKQDCPDIDRCEWSYTDWTPTCSSDNMPQKRTSICKNTKNGTCDDSKCGQKQPLTRSCVLQCCDKSTSEWSCNTAILGTCPTTTTGIYDCSKCNNGFGFLENVFIFTNADANDSASMQNTINDKFKTQGGIGKHDDTAPNPGKFDNPGQNSKFNYAFLFMPGTYTVNIPIGYYTHVAGLGKSNKDVIFNGGPIVDNGSVLYSVGALNNFWRTCENITVNPTYDYAVENQYNTSKTMIYAVSQACSLRSVVINGNLSLANMAQDYKNMGFSSGGFMANCEISDVLDMGSQQQFICRNTKYGTFPNISWNHVNVGCQSEKERKGCCINTTKPTSGVKNLTVVDTKINTVREKPYLFFNGDDTITVRASIINSIEVICPGYSPASGVSNNIDKNIKRDNYKIVNEDITSESLNKILKDNTCDCIIFSPGRYKIDTTIILSGQLLFGLGLPVLTSTTNNTIISGYGNICGIIFEAGAGGNGNQVLVDLSGNPSYLWDIICRVGGGDNHEQIYSVDTMLHIGGDNSVLDNIWCWVADHYADDNLYVGWENAICNIGVHVTGNNVSAYGLFSEHTRKRNVLWDGDNGEVYMFQSELNYYVPGTSGTTDIVSYEIGSTVKNHKLYGAGAYSFFEAIAQMSPSGFKWASTTNVDYQNLVTVFLNGYGGISHIYNDKGPAVEYSKGRGTQIATACNMTTNDTSGCCYGDSVCPICDITRGVPACRTSSACSDAAIQSRTEHCSWGQWLCPNNSSQACYDSSNKGTAPCKDICQWW